MARKDEKLAKRARNYYEKFQGDFRDNIDQFHQQMSFVYGEQWTQDEEDDMIKTFRKVPMVANHLAALANFLLGEQQQNTPQLQVVPMSNCDEQTAQIREVILKDILFHSDTKRAIQVAAMQAAIGGFGAYYWTTEYDHAKSFELSPQCKHLKDPTKAYWDLSSERKDKTDGMYCGYITRMSRKKFREVFGKDVEEDIYKESSITQSKEEIALAVQPVSEGSSQPFTWLDDDSITLINHFERKYVKDKLYKMSNGNTYTQSELDDLKEQSKRLHYSFGVEGEDTYPAYSESAEAESSEYDYMTLYDQGQPVRIVSDRDFKTYKIMHYLIAGDYALEETRFPSQSLPLLFQDHNSFWDKNGKQRCRTFFGDCTDTQRYINYIRTQCAYILKISRYDQYMGSKKNVQSLDTRRNWSDPNATQGLLTYDPDPSGAKPEPMQRPELPQSLTQQYQLAVEDLYRITGLYPARMGEQGTETSGAAVDARTRQGSFSTYVFYNSINETWAMAGQILNEMIPEVFDTERTLTLMMPDSGMQSITINRQLDEYGMQIENDMRKGTYQVRLLPGPSYEGQKQEALESIKQILAADPETFKLMADLYAENLPLPNNIEIKNRLKTLVPPDIIAAGKSGRSEQQQQGPNPEQEMMAMQQQLAQKEIDLKEREVRVKEQEIKIKQQQIMIDAAIEIRKLDAEKEEAAGRIQEQELRYLAETQRTESDEAIAHADNLVKILTHKVKE